MDERRMGVTEDGINDKTDKAQKGAPNLFIKSLLEKGRATMLKKNKAQSFFFYVTLAAFVLAVGIPLARVEAKSRRLLTSDSSSQAIVAKAKLRLSFSGITAGIRGEVVSGVTVANVAATGEGLKAASWLASPFSANLWGSYAAASTAVGTTAVRAVPTTLQAGQNGTVSIEMDSQGNENALGLSITFNPAQLSFVSAVKGADSTAAGATMNVNSASAAAGRVGIALAVPAGSSFSAGTRQIAVFTFSVPTAGNGSTTVGFGDSPIAREIVDVDANTLTASYTSGTITITPLPSPVPTLTSVIPTPVNAGGAAFTLTATGTNFVSGSVVRFNGSNRTTSFVSSTQLTAQITAADIQSTGSFPITVFNPAPGGGTSSTVNLAVNNPLPTVSTLSPTSALAGVPAFTLTVSGTGFSGSSVVRFKGNDRTTSFVSATQLTAQITAADVSAAGTATVAVFNPAPGGGTSNAVNFTINTNPAFRIIRVLGATFQAGQNNTVNVELDAQGDENALGFSLNYDTTKMTFVSAVKGSAAGSATLNINASSTASGHLGLALAVPSGEVFTAGTRQIIVVTFSAPLAASGSTVISFGDTPIAREVVAGDASTLGATYTSGTVNINHPAPTLTSLSPTSALAGDANFTLTVNGSNFVNGSVVRFNGSDRITSFVSGTQLTAQITAADIQSTGSFPITVFTPAPGGGTSSAVSLAVNNPVPAVSTLSPSSVTVGGPAFTLTVNGTGFTSSSTVRFNGTDRATSFVSGTQLTAQITAADVSTAGTATVAVFNPAPGGGTSNAVNFTINTNPAFRIIRVLGATFQAAQNNTVNVELDAQGDENALGFSLNYDTTKMTFVSAVKGSAAGSATLNINASSTASGHLGLALAVPSSEVFTAGTRQIIVVTFSAPLAASGSTVISFGDTPIAREVVAGDASTLGATYTSGTVNINHPAPTLTSLSPTSALAGDANFTLTVNGSNFVNGSVVRFNGSDRITSFVSGTQLTAQITAADIQLTGSFPITVFTPAPGGGTSSAVSLAVNNPVPAISTLSPSSVTVGGPAFTLTVNGTGFTGSSTVRFNGNDRTTSFVSATQLTAQITAADVSAAGTATVAVFNPTPGGGASNTSNFTISTNPALRIVRVAGATFQAGQNNIVNVELDAQGDENALGFSLNFDTTEMTFVSAVKGSDAGSATLNVNASSTASGRLGLALALPTGQTFTPGTRQLAVVTFSVPLASSGSTVVSFGDTPIGREVVASNAHTLGATYASGTVNINHPAPALTSLSPANALAGDADFTLTVNGSNFVNGSVVRFNGSDRTTNFVSATQLTAQISAADVVSAGVVPVTVFTPAPGGGTSSAVNFTINNPVPTLASLSPTSATAGGAAFTLTVNGTNFNSSSVVRFNGNNRTTSFVNATQLTAQITAADIQVAGTFAVSVQNPAPGGGTSSAVDFTVNNPAPTLASLSPTSATASGAAFTLTVDGTNFVSSSVVVFNGNNRTTSFVSATQLTAQISAADVAVTGTVAVTVANPAPGGGTSSAVNFTINNPTPTINNLVPASATTGGAAFTLTVNGSDFVSGSIVRFNGSDRTTSFVNATQLTAQITAADISVAGTANVTVFNPAPGGGASSATQFSINDPGVRTIRIDPATLQAGQNGSVNVELDSQGNENGLGFSLTFDQTKLSFVSVTKGSDAIAATLNVNSTGASSGRVGVAMVLPAGQTFVLGTRQILVLTFSAAPSATGSTVISFGDQPVAREVVDNHANVLSMSFASGTISISPAPNPAPTVGSLSPASAIAGGGAFTLTVNGTNFISGSVVRLNGNDRTTSFVNSTQLTAQIAAADIATAGAFPVTVFNPTPGGGTSNAVNLNVDNPSPAIGSLAPNSAQAGAAALTLTVNGSNFISSSVVRWNGSDRATNFVSGTQLTAQITAADIQSAGTASVTVFNPAPGGGTSSAFTFTINNPLPVVEFEAANYSAAEAANSIHLTVKRSGDTSGAVTVDYATDDSAVFIPCGTPNGGASQRCDYETSGGTISFAPGESSKTLTLLIVNDSYVEGNETLTLTLSNCVGGTLGAAAATTVTILDDDLVAPTNNPIDDAHFFVNQHYLDLLNRVPDQGGLDYWTNEITKCGTDAACIHDRRIGVSAAFFIEKEFQDTGFVVYLLHKAAFGQHPTYAQFMPDRSQLVGGANLATSTLELANRLTTRTEFRQAYPDSMSPADFVNKLYDSAGLVPYTAERADAIAALTANTKTRAQALLDVTGIQEFKDREYNPAFVLVQYFGYLRRDPDDAGYQFWLNVLNNREPNNYRGMVCSFITSTEFQHRFSSIVTHSNLDCGK